MNFIISAISQPSYCNFTYLIHANFYSKSYVEIKYNLFPIVCLYICVESISLSWSFCVYMSTYFLGTDLTLLSVSFLRIYEKRAFIIVSSLTV